MRAVDAGHAEDIQIEEVEYPSYIQEIGCLRADVWLHKGRLDPNEVQNGAWLDGLDTEAKHWVAIAKGELVAAARLHLATSLPLLPYFEEFLPFEHLIRPPLALMMRLVVKPGFRGFGLAGRLDRARIECAQRWGANTLLGNAAPERIRALSYLGFTLAGKIPEQHRAAGVQEEGLIMIKRLDSV